MRRLLLGALLLGLSVSTLGASDFDWMIREFSRQSGAKPLQIPMFGLARLFVGVARPAGTSDLHLALRRHAVGAGTADSSDGLDCWRGLEADDPGSIAKR